MSYDCSKTFHQKKARRQEVPILIVTESPLNRAPINPAGFHSNLLVLYRVLPERQT